ncbi:MAG TPA: hypothetical protein VN809_16635 [Telmatospirillum sp.]|nr:hypothetical protein [Telmatospirillum sp.]
MNHDHSLLPRSQAAIDRLERAVNRLEGAMGRPSGDLFGEPNLSIGRDDYDRLDQTARIVETRLDAVIDRLKIILED